MTLGEISSTRLFLSAQAAAEKSLSPGRAEADTSTVHVSLPRLREMVGTPNPSPATPAGGARIFASRQDIDRDRQLQRKRLQKMLSVFGDQPLLPEIAAVAPTSTVVTPAVPSTTTSGATSLITAPTTLPGTAVAPSVTATEPLAQSAKEKPGGFPFTFGSPSTTASSPTAAATGEKSAVGGFAFAFGQKPSSDETPAKKTLVTFSG
jgi:hypothetical protein